MPDLTKQPGEVNEAVPLTVFAHDLLQPLRAIKLNAQRLQIEGEPLSSSAIERLDEIIAAARTQEELISAVMEYDHVLHSTPLVTARMPLHLAIESAMRTVDVYRISQNGRIRILSDPPASMAPVVISKALEKVLNNSLKFQHAQAIPEVEIEAVNESPEWIAIRISDNGLGIDAKYRSLVFQPFKRLNPISAYPGSGLGLTIARRLLESVDGTLTLEDHNQSSGIRAVIHYPVMGPGD
jgi:signal transduction histidine kinase